MERSKKRKYSENFENENNLDDSKKNKKIKKAKIENTSYGIINMGKQPSNNQKDNVIEIDINELNQIFTNKPTVSSGKKKRVVNSKRSEKKMKTDENVEREMKEEKIENKEEVGSQKKKKPNKNEINKMVKQYGGYFDENDDFIIADDDLEKTSARIDWNNKMSNVSNLDYSSDEWISDVEDEVEKDEKAVTPKINKAKKTTGKLTSKAMKEMDLTPAEYDLMTEEEIEYWKKINKDERQFLKKMEKELNEFDANEVPERFRILKFPVDIAIKRNIMNKFSQIEMMEPTDPEYFKLNKWIEGVMKIPFGKYLDLPVGKNDKREKISDYISKVSQIMENSTFGHLEAKNKIMQVVCQWISNPKSSGNIIALQGPPGIGKTSLVRNGIAKALGRPFHMIALGGATDSTFLEGHNYTYEGSNWGRIASILMDSKIMNPVIFFDELDKVSGTKQGEEIIGVLTHLTDQTQNTNFNDKYFSGIDLDLSRCLFVFSYNDESLINPILRDRLVKINLNGFGVDDKIEIAKNYLLKELSTNIGLEDSEFHFSDEVLKDIIQKFTKEEGVRDLRRCLETILLKLNMAKFINYKHNKDIKLGEDLSDISFPVKVDINLTERLLQNKKEMDFHKTHMMYI